MHCVRIHLVQIVVLAAFVAFAIGCRRDISPPEPVPHGVIRLTSVMPQSDYKALELDPQPIPFPAGALLRIEGEFDTAAAGGVVKLILVQVRQQRRGKSIILRTKQTEAIDNGRYRLTMPVPDEPGEYELSVRARDRFIGRTQLRVVEADEA